MAQKRDSRNVKHAFVFMSAESGSIPSARETLAFPIAAVPLPVNGNAINRQNTFITVLVQASSNEA
jgi:hypothetical protein